MHQKLFNKIYLRLLHGLNIYLLNNYMVAF